MKCPSCGNNQKAAQSMICRCGYAFVFHPKTDGIADRRFAAAITGVSAHGRRWFTVNQLYTWLNNKRRRNPLVPFIVAGVALIVCIVAIIFKVTGLAIFTGFATVIAAATGLYYLFMPPIPRDRFDKWLTRWQGAKGPIDNLINEPRLHTPPPDWQEQDIYDYGAEGVLVVQRPEQVDLLVLNGFHTSQRVLVIAANDYPAYLRPKVQRMLEDNPQLPVYLLHDADVAGKMAVHQYLANSRLPFQGHPVTDLGLNLNDLKYIKPLRSMTTGKPDQRIPIDLIPYTVLTGMLTMAFASRMSFSDIAAAAIAGSLGPGHQGGRRGSSGGGVDFSWGDDDGGGEDGE